MRLHVLFAWPCMLLKTERDFTSSKDALKLPGPYSTFRPWRIIKVPPVVLSRSVSVCPFLLLHPLPFLFGLISESSLRLPDNPSTHTHTHKHRLLLRSGGASFSFCSHQQALTSTHSRTLQGHVEIFQMLSVFQNRSFLFVAAAQNSKVNCLRL